MCVFFFLLLLLVWACAYITLCWLKHTLYEVKSKANNLIWHSRTRNNGCNTVSVSCTTLSGCRQSFYSAFEKEVQSLFCFFTPPLQLHHSSLCLTAFWYIEIYSVMRLSLTRVIIVLHSACKLSALLMLSAAQRTVDMFKPHTHNRVFLFYYETGEFFFSWVINLELIWW